MPGDIDPNLITGPALSPAAVAYLDRSLAEYRRLQKTALAQAVRQIVGEELSRLGLIPPPIASDPPRDGVDGRSVPSAPAPSIPSRF